MKKFKPIAMRCNQQQYAEIEQILIDNGCKTRLDNVFNNRPYLTNNFSALENNINNTTEDLKIHYNRTVFETWDKDIFLEYCGIKIKNSELKELPNTWYVQLTEDNKDIVKNWHKSLSNTRYDYKIGAYYGLSNNKPDSWGENYLLKTDNVITTEQFKKWVLKESKPEFIVGKWYKVNIDVLSYKKFLRLENNRFYWSEEIYQYYPNNIKYNATQDWLDSSFKFTLLTDLSEIQLYLPDGHVDKQNNTLNIDKILEWAEIIESPKTDNNNYEKPTINTKWTPKIGDWVIRIKPGDHGNLVTKNKAYQVKNFLLPGSLWVLDDKNNEDMFELGNFRKAEPHEIPKSIETPTFLSTDKDGNQKEITLKELNKIYVLKLTKLQNIINNQPTTNNKQSINQLLKVKLN
jgi:hypothetical protein